MQLRITHVHVVILNFLLIAALSIVSGMTVIEIVKRSYANQVEAPTPTTARSSATGMRPRLYYDTIVKRDIFNETPLQSRSKPYAIIEDPTGNESLYQVGEQIPDAGKLVSVEVNRALIDRNGHRVAIEIPASDLPEVPPSQLGVPPGAIRGPMLRGLPAAMRRKLQRLRAGAPGAAGDDDNSDDDSSDDNSKIELKKLGPGKFEVSRAEVQQTMENPAQFFSQMRALPHFVNGKTDGFSISQVQPGSVFQQIGLQDGDLLTSIQGQPVTNPMQAMGLIQAVKTASAIDLTVNRGGTPTSVHLDLR
jgi:type II secretion system protein C